MTRLANYEVTIWLNSCHQAMKKNTPVNLKLFYKSAQSCEWKENRVREGFDDKCQQKLGDVVC